MLAHIYQLVLQPPPVDITVKAILTLGSRQDDGTLVQSVAIAWFEILRTIKADPTAAYQIEPRRWEEIIAGAYTAAGYDEVVLTPRSGDLGRDVIATKYGVGSVRIYDQVKAYKPGHVVTAEEVRAMLGVITGADNVSKGVVTTTSTFAPRLHDDPFIKKYLPFRLELKPKDVLFPWLTEVASRASPKGA